MRCSEIIRDTKETKIKININLDGTGEAKIDTGCGFLDHMLTLFASHASFDLTVFCDGDTNVDYHHTVEDVGIALGLAISSALADKRGISRYGYFILPMDESLVLTAIDISGRCHLSYEVDGLCERVGDFDTELIEEFFLGFVRNASITLHIKQISGYNTHHIIECIFKSFAHSMARAVALNEKYKNKIPSTKGVL
jgi:imidazoleglycerol-phosphate dehydratase